ncbi:MAG TPA: ArsR family transcriptional regulator [Candidatus Dormibacteraeota bacterium]
MKTSPVRADVDASPIYELVLQIMVFAGLENLETFDVGREWADRVRARCSPQFLRTLDRLGGAFTNIDQLMGIQALHPSPGVQGFVRRLEQLTPQEVLLHLTGFHAELHPEPVRATILAAAAGSKRSLAAAAKALAADMPERQETIARLLATPAADLKQAALEVITEWYERIFAEDEPRIRTMLAADARAKRALLGTDPERLILIATGIRYGLKDRFTKVLLVPTVVMRPWVAVMNYKRLRIYAYPVVDDPTSLEMARQGLARTYRALGDEARLGILKLLADHALTMEELCQRLEQPEPVMRAHLAVLRAGRIVQINCDERITYQLRGDIMRVIGQPLQAYLKLSATAS